MGYGQNHPIQVFFFFNEKLFFDLKYHHVIMHLQEVELVISFFLPQRRFYYLKWQKLYIEDKSGHSVASSRRNLLVILDSTWLYVYIVYIQK